MANSSEHDIKLLQRVVQGVMLASLLVLTAVLADGFLLSGSRSGVVAPAGSSSRATDSDDTPDGGVLILSRDRREIRVVSPSDGELRGIIRPRWEPAQMTPTPGGVSVFVSYADRSEIGVYSTTDYEAQELISFEGVADLDERIPDHLLFSENGDTLYINYQDSDFVAVFSHSMRRLELQHEFEIPGSYGPLLRNRRGTRLYRGVNGSANGTAVIFAANGEIIEVIPEHIHRAAFNSGFSHIWGLTESEGSAQAVVLDERSGELRQLDDRVLDGPAMLDPGVSGTSGGVAAFLSADGTELRLHDARTAQLHAQIPLEFTAVRVLSSGVGTLWAIARDGRLAVVDPASGVVTGQYQLELDGLAAIVSSVVQSGGNFACF